MTFIDNFLNRITMYRLVLYYLFVLLGAALVYSFLYPVVSPALRTVMGIPSYGTANILFSAVVVMGACWITNTVFAYFYKAVPNVESIYITALILTLLIAPAAPTDSAGILFLVVASVWAMASKYILAIGKKHLFNPAAFGIALSALVLNQSANWWVAGNWALLPFVLIGGLLIVRKIRRFDLVISFAVAALLALLATAGATGWQLIEPTIIHTSFLFLALVMLTEPLTLPPTRWGRITYGALVGLLFAPTVHFGTYYFTPEVALLFGNLFVFFVSPKGRYMLTLVGKSKVADGTYEFAFKPDRPFPYVAGQFLEWTIGLEKTDGRGNRRYFTIASAPTEPEGLIRLGARFYEPKSTFKTALDQMKLGDTLTVSSLAGDFVLPKDSARKIVMIAGGIGVTPFRSQVQYLLDTSDKRPVTLFYANKTASEVAYKELFDQAATAIGLKTVYAITNEPTTAPNTYAGFIDAALIQREVPDYRERLFYISGPHGMVEAFKKTLAGMGVSRFNIRADYFPGFA